MLPHFCNPNPNHNPNPHPHPHQPTAALLVSSRKLRGASQAYPHPRPRLNPNPSPNPSPSPSPSPNPSPTLAPTLAITLALAPTPSQWWLGMHGVFDETAATATLYVLVGTS